MRKGKRDKNKNLRGGMERCPTKSCNHFSERSRGPSEGIMGLC